MNRWLSIPLDVYLYRDLIYMDNVKTERCPTRKFHVETISCLSSGWEQVIRYEAQIKSAFINMNMRRCFVAGQGHGCLYYYTLYSTIFLKGFTALVWRYNGNTFHILLTTGESRRHPNTSPPPPPLNDESQVFCVFKYCLHFCFFSL